MGMNLQWFPGHMAKTRRLMAEHLKITDLAAELVDARLPLSSRNPEIDKILGSKPRLVILNKSDMADSAANSKWVSYLIAGYHGAGGQRFYRQRHFQNRRLRKKGTGRKNRKG